MILLIVNPHLFISISSIIRGIHRYVKEKGGERAGGRQAEEVYVKNGEKL